MSPTPAAGTFGRFNTIGTVFLLQHTAIIFRFPEIWAAGANFKLCSKTELLKSTANIFVNTSFVMVPIFATVSPSCTFQPGYLAGFGR